MRKEFGPCCWPTRFWGAYDFRVNISLDDNKDFRHIEPVEENQTCHTVWRVWGDSGNGWQQYDFRVNISLDENKVRKVTFESHCCHHLVTLVTSKSHACRILVILYDNCVTGVTTVWQQYDLRRAFVTLLSPRGNFILKSHCCHPFSL